jgi:hypothetical protein
MKLYSKAPVEEKKLIRSYISEDEMRVVKQLCEYSDTSISLFVRTAIQKEINRRALEEAGIRPNF